MTKNENNIYKEFGEKIKKLRKEKKLTQTDLANDLGMTQSSIYKYEKGLRKVSISILKKFADYFNLSIDELLDFPFPKKNKDIFSDIISNNHEFIKQIEAWDKEIGTFIFTKENHDKLISFAKFLKEQQLKEETKINSHT